MLSLIVAVSQNGVIGDKGRLPWHFPEDLQYFKKVTWGKSIIMGRTTYAGLPKTLPGRKSIVLSTDREFQAQNPQLDVCHNWAQALSMTHAEPEAMVIGGKQVYESSLPWINRAYITLIHQDYEGDTSFCVDPLLNWKLIWEKKTRTSQMHATFLVLDKP